MDERRKRLVYRASRRSFKEADLFLESFAEKHVQDLTEDEMAMFEHLLEIPDHELYAWILGQTPPPPALDSPFLRRLQAFTCHAGRKQVKSTPS